MSECGLFSGTKAVHKNNSVSRRPAGWLKKGATGDFFFHFCKKKKKSKNGQYFHGEKKNRRKKRKFAAA